MFSAERKILFPVDHVAEKLQISAMFFGK